MKAMIAMIQTTERERVEREGETVFCVGEGIVGTNDSLEQNEEGRRRGGKGGCERGALYAGGVGLFVFVVGESMAAPSAVEVREQVCLLTWR